MFTHIGWDFATNSHVFECEKNKCDFLISSEEVDDDIVPGTIIHCPTCNYVDEVDVTSIPHVAGIPQKRICFGPGPIPGTVVEVDSMTVNWWNKYLLGQWDDKTT